MRQKGNRPGGAPDKIGRLIISRGEPKVFQGKLYCGGKKNNRKNSRGEKRKALNMKKREAMNNWEYPEEAS